MKPSPEAAKQYIREKWPIQKSVEIIKDIDELEIFGFQSTRAKFKKDNDLFSIPFFATESGSPANQQNLPWLTNLFWENNLSSLELPYSTSQEAQIQNYYQNANRERGLDLVYLKEIESLFKETKLLKDNQNNKLENYFNKLSIVSVPKSNIVIVLAWIGQRATGRKLPRPMPIIIKTNNPQKLVDFLFTNKAFGLNAIFSLVNSNDLSPNTPPGFLRSEVFYAEETQIEQPFVMKAQLKEFDIKKRNGKLIGKVKRLQPLES